MKKILTFFATIIFSVCAFAQAPAIQWQKCYGGTSGDAAYSIQQTLDGGYIVAGTTSSSDVDVNGNHGGGDYWIIKLDGSGTIEWQKCYGGTNGDVASYINRTMDHGFIVVGNTASNDGDVSGNHGNTDIWVLKLDSSGAILWQKCLGGTNDENAYEIHETSDNGYIIAGETSSNNGDVSGNHITAGFYSDYWIVKLDMAGSIQWQKCLGGNNLDEARSIKITSDGGYIVAGRSNSVDGDITAHHGSTAYWDYWITKLSVGGNIQWEKSFGGSFDDLAFSIECVSDGGFIVAGATHSNDGDVSGLHDSVSYGFDYWIFKLDSTGNILWQKCLGGGSIDVAVSVSAGLDNSFLIGGYSYSINGDVTGIHFGVGSDYWIVKLDSAGNILWQKCLGGSQSDRPYSVLMTSDLGCIVAGYSESNDGDVTNNHGGGGDFWIVKLAPDVGIEEDNPEYSITLSPNPFSESAILVFNALNKFSSGTIEIKNIFGESVSEPKHFSGNQISIQRNNLPSGIYFYRITTKENEILNGKFIIE